MMRQDEAMNAQEWWYCLRHMRVEPEEGCANRKRLGPYATREEASAALELAAERNEAWEEKREQD